MEKSFKKEADVPKKVLDKKLIEKYSKGDGVKVKNLKRSSKQWYVKRKEEKYQEAEESSARAEVLLTETPGILEAKEISYTSHITQKEIKKAVDITSATKSFDLQLDRLGPYKFRYTQNGRHMVLGGRKGHLASFDWVTKKLSCELNLNESVHDVCFLHTENMFAAAQKEWTYIYDNLGIELHCLKQLHRVVKLEFLPYHFLLCSGSETGFLRWLDVTLGQEVIQFPTRKGRLDILCQNPANAVICCGHSNGTVTMWTPNTKTPVLSMLCHPQSLKAIAVDPSGRFLSTACNAKLVRLWDLRNLGKVLSSYKLRGIAHNLAFSQKQMLSVGFNNTVEVYRNVTVQDDCEVYMRHETRKSVTGLQFCPYEDVLGCSTGNGFSSLIIPGSGEPNFDAWEANPFRGTSARQEAEVKALLEKIPSDLITLDPKTIAQVDVPTLQEKLEVKKQLAWVKPPKVDVKPRYRMKGKSGSAQRFKRKVVVKNAERKQYLEFIKMKRDHLLNDVKKEGKTDHPPQILDRFKSRKK